MGEPTRLYALSAVVIHEAENAQGHQVAHAARHLLASSESEAQARGLALFLAEMPVEDGWFKHQVVVDEIPPAVLCEALGLTDGA